VAGQRRDPVGPVGARLRREMLHLMQQHAAP
jgi:hypothetical protein